MHSRIFFILLSPLTAWCGAWCEPVPLERVSGPDPSDFEQNIAPFLAFRDRHADDLLAHERYQDAVHQHGIEGHLRALTQEYQVLFLEHPRDLVYRYLYARTLAGRSTREAIRHLDEILVENPDFAPAHRTLAEIYASEAFHDAERADAERQKFQSLCPGATVARRPGPLPDPSPLVDEAERLLGENGDPDRAAEMAMNGIRADEWRLQRIRPFDWYSAEFKRQSQRELQAKYWKAWSIQVRCYRKAGRHDKAAELLAQMEERAQSATGSENRAAAAAEIRRLRELITRREPD